MGPSAHHYVNVESGTNPQPHQERSARPAPSSSSSLSSKARIALFTAVIAVLSTWIILQRKLLFEVSFTVKSPNSGGDEYDEYGTTTRGYDRHSTAFGYDDTDDSYLHHTSTAYDTLLQATGTGTAAPHVSPTPMPNNNNYASPQPRMIDIILFNNEMELLDLRLNELYHIVDAFVIIESDTTFSGKPKKLYFQEYRKRFEQFASKIHHVVLPAMTSKEYESYASNPTWANEHYTRNKGVSLGLQQVQPKEGDWILLSDLDEIPRPSILRAMKNPDPQSEISSNFVDRSVKEGGAWDLFRLGCRFFYYSYEYYKGIWVGPVVMRYREPESLKARLKAAKSDGDQMKSQKKYMARMGENNWANLGKLMRDGRNEDAATYVDDAGWHCSWCFSRISDVIQKMKSYSHTEHNQAQYETIDWILDHYRRGIDLFERPSDEITVVPENSDIPDYIRFNRNKYVYMLHRYNAPNAGFLDVQKP
ncbi:hypothetical protein BGZ94_004745 [Podila epigama]|nr:hypothetical protein BGZ94_004745 [Podila epigama]